MKTLCIDASLTSTGWALFDDLRLQKFGKINTQKKDLKRLEAIVGALNDILIDDNVEQVIMEGGFSKIANLKTGLMLAELRGAIKYEISKKNLILLEPAPQQIKKLLTGNGRATKEEVFEALHEIYKNDKLFATIGPFSDSAGKKKTSDVYDAISLFSIVKDR